MASANPAKRILSIALLIAGVALIVVSLVLDVMKSSFGLRGAMLIVGIVALLAGLYFFPTQKRHKDMVNIIFLFPLLFTFAVTVIIPLVLGVFYSLTDWNGIKFNEVVGFANYAAMFKEPSFLWSLLITWST